jgi:formylglycine-generating enzyme required for sulfatase activity
MRAQVLLFVGLLSFCVLLAGCAQEEVSEGEMALEPVEEKPLPGDMIVIPAGEFTMGSDRDPHRLNLAEPAHKVDLPEYEIDVYEVTNAQFARFQIESDYEAEGDWRSYYKIGREDYPVANVTWNDAMAYCEWAGKRVPTEAEWEKAARGNEELSYPWGEVFDWRKANTNEHGVRDTMEVGSMPEDISPYEVYDMMGNVQEWTADELTPYPESEAVDPSVFTKNLIVVRGGSYAMKGESMFLFSRTASPAMAQYGYGFRCVRGGGSEGEEEQDQ